MINKTGYVYMLANKTNKVIYTGVTSDLVKRMGEHKDEQVGGFTKKYNVDKLVYVEETNDIEVAIEREKQIKAGSRKKKIELIKDLNPNFKDLSDQI
jgi:putative endonuclease